MISAASTRPQHRPSQAPLQVHRHCFHIFGQATAVRLLDVRQSAEAPHSLNVAVWPAVCSVWCMLSVASTFQSTFTAGIVVMMVH
jgi:hypothetical protein